jgi:hypothetical protein
MASKEMTLVRYFGLSQNLVLGADFDVIGIFCFSHCKHLLTVGFKPGSRLGRIENSACSNCPSLKSICIAASVEIIGDLSFYRCSSLCQLTFEPGSRLTEIGREAFSNCSSLVSICIPAQVERLLKQSFAKCCSLTELPFERGSKVRRIVPESFEDCRSLRAFCVPGQLEVMEWGLVSHFSSLTELTFEVPSCLRELRLPSSDFGSVDVPDSVEHILGFLRENGARSCVLHFGEESRLIEVKLNRRYESRNAPGGGIGIFLRFSEIQLRNFRSKCESS